MFPIAGQILTVFSSAAAVHVLLAVIVVTCFGVGRYVVAFLAELVGYNGVGFFFVIFVPALLCIGAYMVRPVCSVNGTLNGPSAPAAGTAALSLTLFSVSGPSVPSMSLIPACTFGGKVPVMPLNEKRLE